MDGGGGEGGLAAESFSEILLLFYILFYRVVYHAYLSYLYTAYLLNLKDHMLIHHRSSNKL